MCWGGEDCIKVTNQERGSLGWWKSFMLTCCRYELEIVPSMRHIIPKIMMLSMFWQPKRKNCSKTPFGKATLTRRGVCFTKPLLGSFMAVHSSFTFTLLDFSPLHLSEKSLLKQLGQHGGITALHYITVHAFRRCDRAASAHRPWPSISVKFKYLLSPCHMVVAVESTVCVHLSAHIKNSQTETQITVCAQIHFCSS